MKDITGFRQPLSPMPGERPAIVVLHEIYGINGHISGVCRTLEKRGFDVLAPDLLNGRGPFGHDRAEEAYAHFFGEIGMDKAMVKVRQVMKDLRPGHETVCVLGFSVGATLAWLCSGTRLCDLVVGFYGSRIRDHLSVKPECPTLLFFPAEEKSFDVGDLTRRLDSFPNTRIERMPGMHGFANRFSENYDRASTLRAMKLTRRFVRQSLSV